MRGGTKPPADTRRAQGFKDGQNKSGGIGAKRHAGPGRASKPRPTGVKGRQLQKRTQG
jgi:hypothetical protein